MLAGPPPKASTDRKLLSMHHLRGSAADLMATLWKEQAPLINLVAMLWCLRLVVCWCHEGADDLVPMLWRHTDQGVSHQSCHTNQGVTPIRSHQLGCHTNQVTPIRVSHHGDAVEYHGGPGCAPCLLKQLSTIVTYI